MSQEDADPTFEALLGARDVNLRQLLQAATRRLNARIADGLRRDGYSDLTATHTMFLSNMTLHEDTVTSVAQRASVTVQAAGRLAKELEERRYLRMVLDERDARRRRIYLTRKGQKLMEASFAILADLEQRLNEVGGEDVQALRRCLVTVANSL